MIARRLKAWMPRSLFSRAALILILPVAAILVVGSNVFIQSLYENVTRQMTLGVASEIRLILGRINDSDDAGDALLEALNVSAPLGFDVGADDGPLVDRREWLDLSGRIVDQTLRAEIDGVEAIDLVSRDRFAKIAVMTEFGPVVLEVSRRRLSARNPHQFFVLMGITATAMTVIGLLYMRGQVRPIRRLARAAEAFGKGRVVPYREAGATEVRQAGAAFLDMRDRIERQIEQRTLMLSGVSHDLRTPLTRIRLSLSLMEPTDDTKAIERDVVDMEKMLEAFLSFAKGTAQEDPVMVDPSELLKVAYENAKRAGQPVLLGELIEGETVALRPDAIGRAFDNLITNAVRYGNEALVGLTINADRIVFSIEDSGPGISMENRERALKPFTRLDKARNQDNGPGVGLGLSIATDIAQQHGGNLSLGESQRLGGLLAQISIPR